MKFRKWRTLFLFAALLLGVYKLLSRRKTDRFDVLDYVNPLIGSKGAGHVFAGAILPFGAVQAVWDSATQVDAPAGFVSDGSPVSGLSHLHHSGTGGDRSMGQFSIWPFLCFLPLVQHCKPSSPQRAAIVKDSVFARPGEFGLCLDSGICTATTITRHAAIHRITTQDNRGSPMLLFNPTGDLASTYAGDGHLAITKDKHALRVLSDGKWQPSFGPGHFRVYSCLEMPAKTEAAIFDEHPKLVESTQVSDVDANMTMVFSLAKHAYVKVGVSWKSSAQACGYIDAELNKISSDPSHVFSTVVDRARNEWRSVVSRFDLSLTHQLSPALLQLLYSSLYRVFMMPTDLTGDHPRLPPQQPAFDNFYCIWDTYRTQSPLLSLLWPSKQAHIVNSVLQIATDEGHLPDCRMSLSRGYIQGGSSATALLADSYIRFRKTKATNIDWKKALDAVISDAEVSSLDSLTHGRDHVQERSTFGYVPANPYGLSLGRRIAGFSASRTIEYAFNDFAIAALAKGLGKKSITKKYLQASNDWQNLWDGSISQEGFSGFIQPRLTNGSFLHSRDLRSCSPAFEQHECYLWPPVKKFTHFYESNAWQYSFVAALHDMRNVIDRMGGDKLFLNRLDHAWDKRYIDIGNEPALPIPFLANFAVGGYRKTVDRIFGLRKLFTTSLSGLPGNDDAGSLAAYVVFLQMGIFPFASTNVLLLAAPNLPDFTLGKLRITTKMGEDSTRPQYITSARFNGRAYTRNWLHQSMLERNGHLTLELSSAPNAFGELRPDLPPSCSEPHGFDLLAGS